MKYHIALTFIAQLATSAPVARRDMMRDMLGALSGENGGGGIGDMMGDATKSLGDMGGSSDMGGMGGGMGGGGGYDHGGGMGGGMGGMGGDGGHSHDEPKPESGMDQALRMMGLKGQGDKPHNHLTDHIPNAGGGGGGSPMGGMMPSLGGMMNPMSMMTMGMM
ncbi:hypothetical protein DSO57_1024363 [Entomophthora muscae]|uniref:Uncharacterized protein n=1 Tax=Entomophthora muscae TaxID=34485 RepID=A0ACC2S4V1_9FUNG|nr:hypothetical protein DSO57_1024363 [Entomophthora muscae]